MNYTIKPIVCDYGVINTSTGRGICICNIKRNAELIADILNADTNNSCAYSYDVYPNAKYKIIKAESEGQKMKAYKCDRCGKLFERYEGQGTRVFYSITTDPCSSGHCLDLCFKCNNELQEWVRKAESEGYKESVER